MPDLHTDTEEALEENFGVDASFPYALRADQLADGTYRYALERAGTGEVIAEASDANDHRALERFRDSLNRAPLNDDERDALQRVIAQYDSRVHP